MTVVAGGRMSLVRFAGIMALVFLISGCGKKEVEKELPTPPQVQVDSDALFDEFFDETPDTVGAGIDSVVVKEMNKDMPTCGGDDMDALFSSDGRYVIQISCVASKELAEDVARKFEEKGYPTYLAEVKNPTPYLLGLYYRIRIGAFASSGDATYFGENCLLPDGYDYWVDNRSNDHVGIGDYGLGDTFESTETVETTESTDFVSEPVITEPIVTEPVITELVVETILTTETLEVEVVETTEELPVTETPAAYPEPSADTVSSNTGTIQETSPVEDDWGTLEDW